MSPHYKKNKFEKLRVFCNVVESGSNISYTAKKMNIDLASISKYISSLEKDLKNKLFDRKPRGLILTEYGKEYYEEAKIVVEKLNELYGESIKRGKIKIDTFKIKLIFIRILRFIKDKVKFMIIKIKLRNLVIITVSLSIGICGFFVNNLKEEFYHNKNILLNKIVQNILTTEQITTKLLRSGLMSFEDYILNNVNNISQQKLNDLKDKLQVQSMIILNKEGKIDLMTNNAVSVKGESIFSRCPKWKHLQDKEIVSLPITWLRNRKVPAKVELMYLSKIKKYIYIQVEDEYMQSILNNSIREEDELLDIIMSTPSGQIIIENKKDQKLITNDFLVTSYYLENPKYHILSDKLIIKKSFGGLQKETCSAIHRGFATSNGEYFYNIVAVFSKSQLNKKIKLTYFVFTTLTAILLFIIHAVHKRTDYVARRRKG